MMKKRILLIKAANPTRFNKLVTFPLGIMYISAFLRAKRKDIDIKLLDLRLEYERWQLILKDTLLEYKPDIVGISALTIESDSLKNIAEIVKDHNKKIIVVAGGPHPSVYFEEVLEDNNIDYVVMGEGEVTFSELVDYLIDGGDKGKIRGIAYREDGIPRINEPRDPIREIDKLPFPSYDLVDVEKYYLKTSMSNYGIRRYANLYTSRSCPYRCIYCHNIFGKGFRGRSPEDVVEEIIYIKGKYNIEEVEVIDDVFNFDRNRAIKIFELTQKKTPDLKYSFPNGLRGDRLDIELLKIMKSAGTIMITIAVESASERVQKLIKKHLNLEKTFKVIDDSNRLGILTRGFFMFGFPDETENEIRKTIEFACSSLLHIAMFYITIPFKGTELYNNVQNKIKLNNYSFSDYEYVASRFNLSNVPTEKLIKMQRDAYRRFYSNVWRWWRILELAPYKKDLVRYIPDLLLRLFLNSRTI